MAVKDVGQGAAEHSEQEDEDDHFWGQLEGEYRGAVDEQHGWDVVNQADEVLVGGNGGGTVTAGYVTEQQCVNHGNDNGSSEKHQAHREVAVAARVEDVFAVVHHHDDDAYKREDRTHDVEHPKPFSQKSGRGQGDKDGDGGYDDRGKCGTDPPHAAGLEDAVEKWLRKREQEEPFEVFGLDFFEFPADGQQRYHHERCGDEPHRDEL